MVQYAIEIPLCKERHIGRCLVCDMVVFLCSPLAIFISSGSLKSALTMYWEDTHRGTIARRRWTMAQPWVDMKMVRVSVSIEQILTYYGLTDKLTRKGDQLIGSCPIHKGINKSQFHV